MDDMEAKSAGEEYQLVDKTQSRTKPEVWEKFGTIIECCKGKF